MIDSLPKNVAADSLLHGIANSYDKANLQNANRDFERHVRRHAPIDLEPYSVDLEHHKSDGEGTHEQTVDILLPHEQIAQLYSEKDSFDTLMRPNSADIEQYWDAYSQDEWFQQHPLRDSISERPTDHVPLRLHGYDVPMGKKMCLLVILFYAVLTSHLGEGSRMLIAALPLTHITAGGLHMVYNVIRWSLDCLQQNTWPSTAHDGSGLSSERASKSGQPICGSNVCILAEIVGDWKWVWETLALKWYWQSQLCCHWCRAELSGMMCYGNFRHNAPHRSTRRTHREYLETFASPAQVPPLMMILGMMLERVMHDFMHMVALGVAQQLVGSLVIELCGEGYFGSVRGGKYLHRLRRQLRQAWLSFKGWAELHGISHSQYCFTPGMFSVKSGQSYPTFKGKAANTMRVVSWLAHAVVARHANDLRSVVARELDKLWQLCHKHSSWFTTTEAKAFHKHVRRFLLAYNVLSHRAYIRGEHLWALRPKFHQLDHLGYETLRTLRNPGSHWTFADESYIGKIARLIPAERFKHSRASRNVIRRDLLKVRLRAHKSRRALELRKCKRCFVPS